MACFSQLEIQELEQRSLPKTRLMLENAAFLMQGDTTLSWPLICDPTSRALEWVRTYMKGKGLVEVRYSVSRIISAACTPSAHAFFFPTASYEHAHDATDIVFLLFILFDGIMLNTVDLFC